MTCLHESSSLVPDVAHSFASQRRRETSSIDRGDDAIKRWHRQCRRLGGQTFPDCRVIRRFYANRREHTSKMSFGRTIRNAQLDDPRLTDSSISGGSTYGRRRGRPYARRSCVNDFVLGDSRHRCPALLSTKPTCSQSRKKLCQASFCSFVQQRLSNGADGG